MSRKFLHIREIDDNTTGWTAIVQVVEKCHPQYSKPPKYVQFQRYLLTDSDFFMFMNNQGTKVSAICIFKYMNHKTEVATFFNKGSCKDGNILLPPPSVTAITTVQAAKASLKSVKKIFSQPSSSIHHSRATSSSDSCPINHGHSSETASSNRRAARENQGSRTTATPSPSGDVRSSLKPRDEPSPTSLHRRDFRERQT
ncbi:hypothetical protein STAS_19486 [Striga asiatica]|uniref:Uncharacterized protein n=1 Tax=Striga asiatica TaxID=4170 RepID=A0A5A7QBP2_STRAF|nr:hypothetical protein STAS_19486 [Striga asiatica]